MGENEFMEHLALMVQEKRPTWDGLADRVRTLRGLGICSIQDVIDRLSQLSDGHLCAAIEALGILEIKRAGPSILPYITSTDPGQRNFARDALSSISSRRTYKELARIVVEHEDEDVKWAACHALSFTFDNENTAAFFLPIFTHENLTPRIRAQAAEGLANTLELTDRRKKLFKQAASALISSLGDNSPEVRFWCCFALGVMRARQALSALEKIVTDDNAFCPGWWFVREEAQDAINHIRGGGSPDRDILGWDEKGIPLVPEGYSSIGELKL